MNNTAGHKTVCTIAGYCGNEKIWKSVLVPPKDLGTINFSEPGIIAIHTKDMISIEQRNHEPANVMERYYYKVRIV
jgi:hypothetical protein